ncbi:MAG TPA: NUDIX domain-containing protein [Methylovirgula sp.]|jgi:8-oxo-dGTP pyrophosphatase MutT (NUDIX family)
MPGQWLKRLAAQTRLLAKPLRLGVRGLVIDRRPGGDQVLLVRHTYVAGWYLPGGGVDPGESALGALARELVEETGVELRGAPKLHGVFFNPIESRRDHVVFYVIEEFHCRPAHPPDLEIAEARFFPIDALPAETTRATRARIDEVLRGAPVSELW